MALIRLVLLSAVLAAGKVSGSLAWEQTGPNGFAAKATLSAQASEIPDPVTVRLEFAFPETYQPDLDTTRGNLLRFGGLSQPFRLGGEKRIDSRTVEYTLEPLYPGKFPITFFSIPFVSKDGQAPAVDVISGIFEYTAVLPEAEADLSSHITPLLPIETPLPLSPTGELRRRLMQASQDDLGRQAANIDSRTFPWLGVAGVLIFAAIVLIIRLSPKKAVRVKAGRDKSIISFEQADALRNGAKAEASPEAAKAYFTALADAVRYYIEENYELAATTRTSEEFLRVVREQSLLEGAEAAQVEAFLRICDAVKFGNYRPSSPDIALAHATVQELINSPKTN